MANNILPTIKSNTYLGCFNHFQLKYKLSKAFFTFVHDLSIVSISSVSSKEMMSTQETEEKKIASLKSTTKKNPYLLFLYVINN